MRPYHYRCNDYSLLTPAFTRWFVTPLLRFIPWAIPANVITIFFNLFVYAGLYLSLNPEVFGQAYTKVLIGFCLLAYIIGDHLDGMQAKRTDTGSALGEFCDHYLDAFNNGIIVFTMLTIFGISNPFIVGVVISSSYLAHMAVFYEQFKTGWLTFEKLGSLEGVLFAALIIGLSAFDFIRVFFSYTLFGQLSIIELTMLSSALGALITFFTTWKRIPNLKAGYWFFTIMLVAVTGLGMLHFNNLQLFTVITLYSSLYIGRIMQGHLVDGVERHTDWPTPLYILLLILFDVTTDYSFLIIILYLMVFITVLIVQVFMPLRVYWVWVNAKEVNSH